MLRRSLLAGLLALTSLVTPGAGHASTFVAQCWVSLVVNFSPNLKYTLTNSTMEFSDSSTDNCNGTLGVHTGGISGGAAPGIENVMSCESIAVIGSGSVKYGSAPTTDITWVYVGTAIGGSIAFEGSIAAGGGAVADLAATTDLGKCLMTDGLDKVTLTGAIAFADP